MSPPLPLHHLNLSRWLGIEVMPFDELSAQTLVDLDLTREPERVPVCLTRTRRVNDGGWDQRAGTPQELKLWRVVQSLVRVATHEPPLVITALHDEPSSEEGHAVVDLVTAIRLAEERSYPAYLVSTGPDGETIVESDHDRAARHLNEAAAEAKADGAAGTREEVVEMLDYLRRRETRLQYPEGTPLALKQEARVALLKEIQEALQEPPGAPETASVVSTGSEDPPGPSDSAAGSR